MKKIWTVLTVLTMVTMAGAPFLTHAGTFVGQDSYSTTAQESIVGNLYVAGGTVMIGSEVGGDLIVFGGTLTTTGRVEDDLFAGGGNVQLLGPVDGDVRMAGGQVSMNDIIGGELLVLGGTVNLLANSVVQGDVSILGGQVVIDGTVRGSIRYLGGRLTINGTVAGDVNAKASERLVIGPNASIGGSLSYKSPKEAQIAQGAQVAGKVSYEPMTELRVNKQVPRAAFLAVLGILTALRTLALLGAVLLAVWLWRRSALDVVQEASDRFWPSLGRGLVYAVLAPIAIILLMVSFIGFIPGVLLLLGYIGLMIMVKVLSGIFLGAWLWAIIKKKSTMQVTWASAIIGLVILEFIGLIPLIGWIVRILITLALFGVLATRVQKAIL